VGDTHGRDQPGPEAALVGPLHDSLNRIAIRIQTQHVITRELTGRHLGSTGSRIDDNIVERHR